MRDRSRSKIPRPHRLRRADLAAVALRILHFRISADNGRSLYVRKSRQVAGLGAVPDVDSPRVDVCRGAAMPGAGSLWVDLLADVKAHLRSVRSGATVVSLIPAPTRPGYGDRPGRSFHVRRPARRRLKVSKLASQGFQDLRAHCKSPLPSTALARRPSEVGSIWRRTAPANAEPGEAADRDREAIRACWPRN